MKRSIIRGALLTLLVVLSMQAMAAEPAQARKVLSEVLSSIVEQNYQGFLALGSDEFRSNITEAQFSSVAGFIGPRLKAGYQADYLTTLSQQGYEVQLWKISFQDKADDSLARMVVVNGEVAGFLLQ